MNKIILILGLVVLVFSCGSGVTEPGLSTVEKKVRVIKKSRYLPIDGDSNNLFLSSFNRYYHDGNSRYIKRSTNYINGVFESYTDFRYNSNNSQRLGEYNYGISGSPLGYFENKYDSNNNLVRRDFWRYSTNINNVLVSNSTMYFDFEYDVDNKRTREYYFTREHYSNQGQPGGDFEYIYANRNYIRRNEYRSGELYRHSIYVYSNLKLSINNIIVGSCLYSTCSNFTVVENFYSNDGSLWRRDIYEFEPF